MNQLLWRYLSTAAVIAGFVLIAGCGGGQARSNTGQGRPRGTSAERAGDSVHIAGVKQTEVGDGAQGALILSGSGPAGEGPVVIFLHAWGPPTPLFYEEWMSHLVGDGVTVIFPAYQSTALATLPQNVQTSVRAALKRLSVAPSSVVVAGDTTGAALAIDYAASAAAAGLPPACAVYGVFPGVNLGTNTNIPLSDPAKIPVAARLVLVAGPSDPVPGGTGLAEAIIAGAKQIPRSHRRTISASGDDPNGPFEHASADQRTYWRPLDRLIAGCAKR